MKPSALLFIIAVVLALTEAVAQSPASGDFNCDQYDPQASQNNTVGCLANLKRNQTLYEGCRDSSNATCYIFLQEPPFINFHVLDNFNASDEAIRLQEPFKCGKFKQHLLEAGGISGIALELHNRTSSADDWCMWGGHADHCTFNQLVDFTDIMAGKGYRFAVTGLLLETPQRQCRHQPSAPLIDNGMIIIGKTDPNFRSSRGPLDQLVRPFESGAWGLFIGLVVFIFIMSLAMAWGYHWSAKKSLVSACFIFAGHWEEVMGPGKGGLNGGESTSSVEGITKKYALASLLFRIALVALIAIFALFYEVAVVNFLFQNQNQSLSKSVTRLSPSQLEEFVVLKNSALENVWNETVGTAEQELNWSNSVPWKQCPTATDCIKMVQGTEADFMVTFEVVGKYLLSEHSSCDKLTIHETRDVLYQFNGGWLYNMAVTEERRFKVDRELVGLRIEGKTTKLVDDALLDYTCSGSTAADNIGTMTILIPCVLFVIPPLLGSIFVMLCWKPKLDRTSV